MLCRAPLKKRSLPYSFPLARDRAAQKKGLRFFFKKSKKVSFFFSYSRTELFFYKPPPLHKAPEKEAFSEQVSFREALFFSKSFPKIKKRMLCVAKGRLFWPRSLRKDNDSLSVKITTLPPFLRDNFSSFSLPLTLKKPRRRETRDTSLR